MNHIENRKTIEKISKTKLFFQKNKPNRQILSLTQTQISETK